MSIISNPHKQSAASPASKPASDAARTTSQQPSVAATAIERWQRNVQAYRESLKKWLEKISSQLRSYRGVQMLIGRWEKFIQQRTQQQPTMPVGTHLLCLTQNAIESLSFEIAGKPPRFHAQYASDERAKKGKKNREHQVDSSWLTPERLRAFFRSQGWSHGGLLLVIATAGIRHRMMQVGARNTNQIRQLLGYQLRYELLEELDNLVYDFSLLPLSLKDGKSEILVRLFSKQQLMEWVRVCEEEGLHVRRVTFSAEALYESLPAGKARECMQVYLGADEVFVNHVLEGVLYQSYALETQLGVSPGEKNFGEFCKEVNGWMQLQGRGDGCEVLLCGLYADRVEWDKDAGLRIAGRKHKADRLMGEEGSKLRGVLEYLVRGSRPLLGLTGPSFYRGRTAWVAWMRVHRAGLVTGLVLLCLVSVFGGMNLSRIVQGRQQNLQRLKAQVQQILGLQGDVSSLVMEDALQRLTNEVGDLKAKYRVSAELEGYHYEVMRLLAEISKAVGKHEGMRLDSFRYIGLALVLGGSVRSYGDSEALKDALLAIPAWKNGDARLTHSRSGEEIAFQLNMERKSIISRGVEQRSSGLDESGAGVSARGVR